MAKPVKIKRYKRSVGGQKPWVAAVKRYAVILLAVIVLLAVGFLAAWGAVRLFSSMAKRRDKRDSGVIPPSSRAVSQSSGEGDSSAVAVKSRVYYYADISRLSGEKAIDALIADVKRAGADRCVFDAKDRDGYINYKSENEYGSLLVSDRRIDIDLVVRKLKDAGITPVARIYAFRDNMISTVEKTTAVMYRDTDFRWLDSSAALGGKSWANPASDIMRQYLVDITDEVMSKGVTEIIYAGFSTPTGYSLEDRGFGRGVGNEQLLGHLRNLITNLKGRIAARGGFSAWQFEYSAVVGGRWRQYIVHPYNLETDNIIMTVSDDEDMERAAARLENAVRNGDIRTGCIWPTGSARAPDTGTGGKFVK